MTEKQQNWLRGKKKGDVLEINIIERVLDEFLEDYWDIHITDGKHKDSALGDAIIFNKKTKAYSLIDCKFNQIEREALLRTNEDIKSLDILYAFGGPEVLSPNWKLQEFFMTTNIKFQYYVNFYNPKLIKCSFSKKWGYSLSMKNNCGLYKKFKINEFVNRNYLQDFKSSLQCYNNIEIPDFYQKIKRKIKN